MQCTFSVLRTLSRCARAVCELRPPPTKCSSSLTRCRAQLRFSRLKTCTSLPAEMEHLVRVRVRVKVRVRVRIRVKVRVRVRARARARVRVGGSPAEMPHPSSRPGRTPPQMSI
eukprot:scaffold78613_cov30-Phaeocystis_antarctica.AAC.1